MRTHISGMTSGPYSSESVDTPYGHSLFHFDTLVSRSNDSGKCRRNDILATDCRTNPDNQPTRLSGLPDMAGGGDYCHTSSMSSLQRSVSAACSGTLTHDGAEKENPRRWYLKMRAKLSWLRDREQEAR